MCVQVALAYRIGRVLHVNSSRPDRMTGRGAPRRWPLVQRAEAAALSRFARLEPAAGASTATARRAAAEPATTAAAARRGR